MEQIEVLEQDGIYHRLWPIYHKLNEHYFEGKIGATIGFGQCGKKQGIAKRSIRLGSYDDSKKRITIHPALDQAFVPRLCVERIVYHEMLHQKHPTQLAFGKRIVHSKAFKLEEALFEDAVLADRLLHQLLPRLLAYQTNFLKNLSARS